MGSRNFPLQNLFPKLLSNIKVFGIFQFPLKRRIQLCGSPVFNITFNVKFSALPICRYQFQPPPQASDNVSTNLAPSISSLHLCTKLMPNPPKHFVQQFSERLVQISIRIINPFLARHPSFQLPSCNQVTMSHNGRSMC